MAVANSAPRSAKRWGDPVSAPPLLSVRGVSKRFRGLAAVTNVSFDVPSGAIFALIGPNGAGKTTMFNMIAGMLRPDAGSIMLEGVSLVGKRPDAICKSGIGRTFQNVRPFHGMTVEENVTVGALAWTNDVATARKHALELLELLELADKWSAPVSSITLPDRKRLEVARALATRPKLLLLDEAMAGLRPTEIDRMLSLFRHLNARRGVTILLIEHVMRAVMALSQHIIVLHHGEVIATGSPDEVTSHRAVLESYLGEEAL
jgi:branched-chain amino acid transport system ATP-binding protein